MTINGWLQIVFFLGLVFLVTKPLGVFMTRVFNREKTLHGSHAEAGGASSLSPDRRR